MDVVRDVLDKLVVDRNGREMGRVDGIVLDQREGEPPRFSSVLIGPAVLGYRLHPTIGRWVAALERAIAGDHGQPVRIDVGNIAEIGRDVRIDRTIGEAGAGSIEQRLRKWLMKIPGGR